MHPMGSNEQRQQPCYSMGSGIVICCPWKRGMEQWQPLRTPSTQRYYPHDWGSAQVQNIHEMELPFLADGSGQPQTVPACSPHPLSVLLSLYNYWSYLICKRLLSETIRLQISRPLKIVLTTRSIKQWKIMHTCNQLEPKFIPSEGHFS